MILGADIQYPRFLPVGDMALTIEFGNKIDASLNDRVMALDLSIAASEIPGVIETMPAYRSLLVCYDPSEIAMPLLVEELQALLAEGGLTRSRARRVWTVPVAYGGVYGDDLEEASSLLGLTPDEVVTIHSGAEYLVYLVGFNPGSPNLGGLPQPLHIPRRKLPRPMAPAGSVAIGGMQSGITSIPSPTGWYILGRTPVRPYHPDRADPFLFQPGDYLRFRPIAAQEFDDLARMSPENGTIATLETVP